MGNETEPAKLLLPYLQRADELQKHEPLVSYYCRLYAMERGLRIPQKDRTKTTNALLVSLMNQLEKDKKSVQLGPEDNLYVEGFASNVFAKADKQDRAARADLSTAKTFYAASIFFEILSQFGELQPDIEQKQKYAVWKAAEIRKALKEGRRPEPGPPGGDKDLSVPSSSPTNTYDLGPRENLPSSQLDGYTSSRPGDKDLGRKESFQASYTGADLPNPHVDKANLHGSTQDFGRRESFRDNYTGAELPKSHADKANLHGSTQSSFHPPQDLGRRESFPASYTGADLSTPHVDNINLHGPTQLPPSPSSYSSSDYSSSNFHQPPPASRPDVSAYPQIHQQPYLSDQHSLPQSYNHPPEIPSPSYSYPNFQSYPGFQDSTFPTAPTHQPSYFHAPDVAYSHQSPPASNQSTTMYDSGNRNGNHPGPQATSSTSFKYDPNYQPPVEKITEAHKAARFAVGALAFDDVPVAVDFLRRSLELLTNPSAETH